jgi:hypothetical protein
MSAEKYLFHQNMRRFGGDAPGLGRPDRNRAYATAFENISATLTRLRSDAANAICVAGFTEIDNENAAPTALGDLCQRLGVRLTVVANCGIMALQEAASRPPEFIGIGVSANFRVLSVGRIMLDVSGQDVARIHVIAPSLEPRSASAAAAVAPFNPADPQLPAWRTNLPRLTTLDYRGVIYVVVDCAALSIKPFAVGFAHNVFSAKENLGLFALQIPKILATMASNPFLNGAGPVVYLGGDYNADGLDRSHLRIGDAPCYSATTVAAAPPSPAAVTTTVPAGASAPVSGGTTWNGNIYDYWHTNIANRLATPMVAGGVAAPVPSVRASTMTGPANAIHAMSDHAACLLQIV